MHGRVDGDDRAVGRVVVFAAQTRNEIDDDREDVEWQPADGKQTDHHRQHFNHLHRSSDVKTKQKQMKKKSDISHNETDTALKLSSCTLAIPARFTCYSTSQFQYSTLLLVHSCALVRVTWQQYHFTTDVHDAVKLTASWLTYDHVEAYISEISSTSSRNRRSLTAADCLMRFFCSPSSK